jgi:glycyl-tRNA synthetase beta chain
MPDLLLELFSEEIPARMQARARDDLKKLVTDGLVEAGLTYAGAGVFSTPRRLVLAIEGLTAESKPVREERKGPKSDAPDAAIDGFLRSTGLRRDQLELRDDKKGQVFFAVVERPGRAAPAIVAEVVESVIRNFPWPKSMRWGEGALRWVRPLHSILCILGDEAGAEVVPLTVDHLTAGNTTCGHRFLAPARFAVSSMDDYTAKLRRAFVMLDTAEREAHIWNDATNLAFAGGMEVVPDAGLLTEVAGLVEWPVVLMGKIGEAFLDLPPEVLQTSMREHQKFFSVRAKSGRIEGFVTVANTETKDHGATILAGNQKVLSARLSDAKFFWENDLRVAKAGMGEWLDGLAAVTFHNKLGSQADRVARITALAREIAPLVGADADLAEQAAKVAKADLRSAMVGEFPELQGLMGMYYARAAGMPEAVALAARDHYAPLGPTDAVPTDPVSVAVALADKIDMLTGFWAIDEKPTGSKDPFALRRAALGVIRLVLGNAVTVPLGRVLDWAYLLHMLKHLQDVDPIQELYSSLDAQYQSNVELVWKVNPIRRMLNWDGLIDSRQDDIEWAVYDYVGAEPEHDEEDASRVSKASQAFVAFRARVDELATFSAVSSFMGIGDTLEGNPVQSLIADYEGHDTWSVVWKRCTVDLVQDLLAFFHDRLKVYLRDQGIRHDVIDACLAMPGNDDLTLLVKRAEALAAFLKTEDGPNLLQGYKRANKMLTDEEAKDGVEYSYGANVKFADCDEERALFAALDVAEAKIAPAMQTEDFAAAMAAMAQLRAPIDAFFTAVQVNADSAMIRRNRLNLLHRIRSLCGQVADLTKLDG